MEDDEIDCGCNCNGCGYFDTSIPHDSYSVGDCCTRKVGDPYPKPKNIVDMNICVFGLWHLGCVTAACLADKGFNVVGLDPSKEVIENLNKGKPPIQEPHLDYLINKNLNKNLKFTTDISEATKDAEIIWVTFDTPVDDNDKADEIYVKQQIMSLYPYFKDGITILISSQLSVGSTSKLEEEYKKWFNRDVSFAYSPENLRLGKAIKVFDDPERIVIGAKDKTISLNLHYLLNNICDNIIWMTPESAEMTKHALNSFLATEIAFINEISKICEMTGADVRDVEAGLKSDSRIGEKAYLKAGSAFSGGTLARDLIFLNNIKDLPLLSSVIKSNDYHKSWILRTLGEHFDMDLNGKRITILGLTYKPKTNTLRRSGSVELCKKLIEFGANIKTHDPSITELPEEYSNFNLCTTIAGAIHSAEVIIIATEWDIYKNLDTGNLPDSVVIIDANGFIRENFIGSKIKYYSVGRGIRYDS